MKLQNSFVFIWLTISCCSASNCQPIPNDQSYISQIFQSLIAKFRRMESIYSDFLSNQVMQSAAPFNLDSGILSFASDLYGQVSKVAKGDVIVSPFSAQTILALTLQGAAGLTASQLIAGLKFDTATPAAIAQSYHTVLAPLQNNPILKTVNKIYLQQGYSPKPTFNEIAIRDFYASADQVDFSQSQLAANKINSYVANQTNNLITNLIPSSALNSDTRMVLVNAIYFKGNWTKSFNMDATYDENFDTDLQTSAAIPTMHITDKFNFAELDDYDAKAIELQYVNSNISMFVILPNEIEGIHALESKLQTNPLFGSLSSQLTAQKVEVSLPKFKTTFSVILNDALKNLGMSAMFASDSDFSNLLEQPEPLEVSAVFQKAFIEVNEEGTAAAAATGVVITTKAAMVVPSFKADHPFIYWIQERNKYPYFIGRFMNIASE